MEIMMIIKIAATVVGVLMLLVTIKQGIEQEKIEPIVLIGWILGTIIWMWI